MFNHRYCVERDCRGRRRPCFNLCQSLYAGVLRRFRGHSQRPQRLCHFRLRGDHRTPHRLCEDEIRRRCKPRLRYRQSMGCMTTLILASAHPDLYAGCMFVDGRWDVSSLKGLEGQHFVYFAAEDDERAFTGMGEVIAIAVGKPCPGKRPRHFSVHRFSRRCFVRKRMQTQPFELSAPLWRRLDTTPNGYVRRSCRRWPRMQRGGLGTLLKPDPRDARSRA